MNTLLSALKRTGVWLILSSKDSTRLSTTVKGSAIFTVITAIAPLMGVQGLEGATDSVLSLIVAIGQVLSAGVAVWGAVRKVATTFGGTNAVLNDKLWN